MVLGLTCCTVDCCNLGKRSHWETAQPKTLKMAAYYSTRATTA